MRGPARRSAPWLSGVAAAAVLALTLSFGVPDSLHAVPGDDDAGASEQGQQTMSSEPMELEISELDSGDASIDGAMVTVSGEVVGERVRADDEHCWITLVSDGVGVSVYMADDDADRIQHMGEYGEIGDSLRVTGVYTNDCWTHQGEVDIHALTVEVEESGSELEEEPDMQLLRWALALLVLGAVAAIIYWRMWERTR